MSTYDSTDHCLVDNLEDVVGPDDVKDEQDGQQNVENVVGGKHLHYLKLKKSKKIIEHWVTLPRQKAPSIQKSCSSP